MVNISIEDGSVRVSNAIVFHSGMTYCDAYAMKNLLEHNDSAAGNKHSIIFPPYPNASTGFWIVAFFRDESICGLLLQVPYMNSTPMNIDEQISYMETNIGKDFFDCLDAHTPQGLFPWGTIKTVWNTRDAVMEIRITYNGYKV